jgi:signal transduction histidine kinase
LNRSILTMDIRTEQDVVFARQRVRQLSGLLGFDLPEQTRLATALSEIARNAFKYAGGANVEFFLAGETPQKFSIRVRDRGPGIKNLEAILNGRYRSETGMGLGILGSKRLMDHFQIETKVGTGTTITFGKTLPRKNSIFTQRELGAITEKLAELSPPNPLEELQAQNQELLRVLNEVRQQKEELGTLNQQLETANRELDDTNRGVVALYAELDEKAETLQRANEIKTRFLSNMTHEFRTPLNSTLSLSKILLDQTDGPLNAEQKKQVSFIRSSAEALSELVNDLLDLSKVAAGKVAVRPSEFRVEELFGALRGMLKPLLAPNAAVSLIFDDAVDGVLETDQGKVSQILRNFISNALKYTERGEIRVTAKLVHDSTVVFSVSDTGIGIAPEDQERIFEEFVQLDSRLQKNTKGTGLGLPLSRKLADLLGGRVELKSEPGIGSTFYAILPKVYRGPENVLYVPELQKILIIDDDDVARYILKSLLATRYSILESSNARDGIQRVRLDQPNVVILDLLMPVMSGFEALKALKADPKTRSIPVIINTSMTLSKSELETLNSQAFAIVSKETKGSREQMIAHLCSLLEKAIAHSADTSQSA